MGAVWEVASLLIFYFVDLAKLSALLLTKESLWILSSIGPSTGHKPLWWPSLAHRYSILNISFAILPLVSTRPHNTSFIPSLLSKTIWSLSLCHETGSDRLGYCVHLL